MYAVSISLTKRLILFLTLFLCSSTVSAQINARTAFRVRAGNSLPATCNATTGQVFFLNTGVAGIYSCTATDTWTLHSTTAGITASTTQTQGQGALTAEINQVSTVANDDDTVTLPAASAGMDIEIINDGANDLQIFPASGDDLGLGANIATSIEPGSRLVFLAYDSTNWDLETSAITPHGEMHDNGNTDAFGISVANNVESYHTNGLHVGDVLGWTFDAGGAGTSFSITEVATDAVGILVTTSAVHGLASGAIVSQANLTNGAYEGVFVVQSAPTTTTYTVIATFGATDTGTMNEAATLTASAIAVGDYSVAWQASVTTATNNETIDFDIYVNATGDDGLISRNKFGTATDIQSLGGVGILSIASGDKVSFAIINTDTAGDITIRDFVIALHRL